ncbi:unnamed protein product [Diatraea saccharalis]|uniref:Protein rolling stone-like n=1 Tax=Diatraea saccharalis TaxID=40085 RepID=A0A9N9RHP6_9NEOP|nr:unnamed protein product [Diatraea saccharalis]
MVKLFRNNLSVSDVWVSSNDKLSDFYASSWQRGESPVPMLVIRLVLAAVATGLLIWSLVEGASPYWLIYLTNWGLLLVTMMTTSGLLVSIIAICAKPDYDDIEVPWYIGVYWFIYNIAVSLALMITALYWILLYNPDNYESRRMFWFDLSTHGFNSCIAIVELLVSRTPLRLLHIYQPLGIGVWYAVFTAIYYAAGGTDSKGEPYIYEVLDWRNGRRSTAIIFISFGGLMVIYIVLCAVTLARDKISTSLVRMTSHDLPPTPPDLMHSRLV